MQYIVIILIVICIFPLIPLAWYGIKEDYERRLHHAIAAILCTIFLMVVYSKTISFVVELVKALLF